jgi:hypothetical protein
VTFVEAANSLRGQGFEVFEELTATPSRSGGSAAEQSAPAAH